jgi:hypothetical protein
MGRLKFATAKTLQDSNWHLVLTPKVSSQATTNNYSDPKGKYKSTLALSAYPNGKLPSNLKLFQPKTVTPEGSPALATSKSRSRKYFHLIFILRHQKTARARPSRAARN